MSQHPYPPSPPANAPLLTPLRRQRVAQPPTLLTTSLTNNAHHLGLSVPGNSGQTPASTTSLSSVFAAHSANPYSPAAGPSPMALRGPTSFAPAAAYNPQQWGPIGADGSPVVGQASSMGSVHGRPPRPVMYAPRMQGPDEPMGSPPPPYSADSGPSSADTTSPRTDFSYGTTPSSAATTISPGGATITIGIDRRSPGAPCAQNASPLVGNGAFPPPPPAMGTRARSSSRNHADRLLSAMSMRRNNTTSPTAMDSLQQSTAQLLNMNNGQAVNASLPPGSRRAASTGALGSAYTPRSPIENGSPAVQQYGVTIPPPPPGLPPTANRSQSLNRPSDISTQHARLAAPRTRQPPANGTSLGPVPPTPADWREDDQTAHGTSHGATEQASWQPPLHIQTGDLIEGELTESPASAHPNGSHVRRDSAGGLVRSPAVRNRSAQGLRERRNASRTGRQGSGEISPEGVDAFSRPLADLVLTRDTLASRRASTRNTPRSAKNFQGLDEALTSADSIGPLSGLRSGSSMATPHRGQLSGHTSPDFSPGLDGRIRQTSMSRPESRQSVVHSPQPAVSSLSLPKPSESRPLSHLLHMPNEEDPKVRVMPLSPESTHSLMDFDQPTESADAFAERASQRHRVFLQKEASASSDSERLHLFTEYMVAESRIRREKYAAVFRNENIKHTELLEGMFEEPKAKEVVQPKATRPLSAQNSRRSSGTSLGDSHSQAHSRQTSTTATSDHVQLTLDTTVNDPRGKSFVPALSPIASMSAVTGRDETESRGRAPSRWWESQSNSSNQGDGFDVLKRTKRESKYMSAVIEDTVSPVENASASSGRLPSYGDETYEANEYPPEKTGWHENERTPSRQTIQPPTPMSAPFTPDPRKLDVSRLITLPPPYPRRHPAVNNSHPDLGDIRNVVRALHEFGEADAAKSSFETRVVEKRKRADSWAKHQRSLHNQDVSFRMEHGEISQAEFDAAESALEQKLSQSATDLVQQTFELYQTEVTAPIHPEYTKRIERATSAFVALSNRLISDSETHSPNLAQEGGDEKPELLEKLTMLKWLFEARETLHRAQHELLTQRNELYRETVTLPYKQSNNAAKLNDALSFFATDKRKRQSAFDASVLQRWREFRDILTPHVTRGVEVQLSAFWDIAPNLQNLLQRIPESERLKGFEILIPKGEVDENPSYWAYPLRYLYSVLNHAEASSRQFVDAQVSLWCLLQEVREGVAGKRARAKMSQRAVDQSRDVGDSEPGEEDRWEMQDEIQKGVDDLKERVASVEQQWIEGLGGEIGRVRESVKGWLLSTGGWDDELDGED